MVETSRDNALDSLKKRVNSHSLEDPHINYMRLRKYGDYSDLVVTCGEYEYKVHKAIVCPRSTFFASAIQFSGKEAQEGKINFPEEEPDIIKRLIQYLYEGVYGPPRKGPNATTQRYFPHTCPWDRGSRSGHFQCFNRMLCPHHDCRYGPCSRNCRDFICRECVPEHGAASDLITHAKMYEAGDKYGVVRLKELALSNFEWVYEFHWDAAEFSVAAHHAFTTTPENDKGLRDIVSNTISQHRALIRKPGIEALMHEFPGLAYGLLKQFIEVKEAESVHQGGSSKKKKY